VHGPDRRPEPDPERPRATRLAYVETSLPGADRAARLELAHGLGLELEIACRRAPGESDRGEAASWSAVAPAIVAVQAHRMHEVHPLHPDAAVRAAARVHLADALELAARVGARHVVAVCGFGQAVCRDPFGSSVRCFAAVADRARALGVRVLIELLGPGRAGALTGLDDVPRLLAALDAPDVFGCLLDTGHLLDAGRDPEAVLGAWPLPVEAVQLRGPGSRPPGAELPWRAWLAALGAAPRVVSVEHRAPTTVEAVERLVAELREATAA